MGCWLRRCSSICPRTSCGAGTGSHPGLRGPLPAAPQGCGRQGAEAAPGCRHRQDGPRSRSPRSRSPSAACPAPPACSRPGCCCSAACRAWRASRSRSAGPAGPAPAAAPCCAWPGLCSGPGGCPHRTSPPRSPCWRWPGRAGSQPPPAGPGQQAAVSGQASAAGSCSCVPSAPAPGQRRAHAWDSCSPPSPALPTMAQGPRAPAPGATHGTASRASAACRLCPGPLTSWSLLWALREDKQGSTHSCQGSTSSWYLPSSLLRILRDRGARSGQGTQGMLPACPACRTGTPHRTSSPGCPGTPSSTSAASRRALLCPHTALGPSTPHTAPTRVLLRCPCPC